MNFKRLVRTKTFIAIFAAFFAGAVASTVSVVLASGTSTTTYYACLKAGYLSTVSTQPHACINGAKQISWNQSGPQGPTGEAGPQGPAGQSDHFTTASTSTYTIGATPGKLTVATGLSWTEGQTAIIATTSINYVVATISSYDAKTGELNFTISSTPGNIVGSGTFNTWVVNLGGATGAQGWSGGQGPTGAGTCANIPHDGTDLIGVNLQGCALQSLSLIHISEPTRPY